MSDKNTQNPKIVMIGDSLTDWCDWNIRLGRTDILNSGIAGDSTVDLLHRMDNILNSGAMYGLIMIGTNDISRGRSVSSIIRNYIKILKSIKAHNITIIVQLVLYTKDFSKNKKITELNNKLKEYCALERIRVLDLNPLLAKDGLLGSEYSDDGLHLNDAGYNAWAEVLKDFINLLIKDI